MRYSKLTKYTPDALLALLIMIFLFVYFVIYLTPVRIAFYHGMAHEAHIAIRGLINTIKGI